MNTLISLRNSLKLAEKEYKEAQSSLDNSLALIYAKDKLKQARFDWNKACSDVMEKILDDAFLNQWIDGKLKGEG